MLITCMSIKFKSSSNTGLSDSDHKTLMSRKILLSKLNVINQIMLCGCTNGMMNPTVKYNCYAHVKKKTNKKPCLPALD